MKTQYPSRRAASRPLLALITTGLLGQLSACGGGGAAVQAQAQSVSFTSTPALTLQSSTTVSTSSTSGLPVRFSSRTPAVCSVDGQSGQVTALSVGTCTIVADQPGNEQFAPAQAVLNLTVSFDPHQSIQFAAAPTLTLGGSATVSAMATSGLPVSYTSGNTAVCSVDTSSGQVQALTAGTCTVYANQAGDARYLPAAQTALSLTVVVPSGLTAPDAPTGVTARSGNALAEVILNANAINGGGVAITAYAAVSSPSGYAASSSSLPIRVSCPSTCAGESFTLRATNAVGDGAWSSATHIVDTYDVQAVFREPMTQPNDSVFVGTFTYDSTTRTVSQLQGKLSESMTGSSTGYPNDTMTWLTLNNQLKSWHDSTLGGTFVATFKNTSTSIFSTSAGGDGWSPQAGVDTGGIYNGFPVKANNPGNAYVLIFVPDDPSAPLTASQMASLPTRTARLAA